MLPPSREPGDDSSRQAALIEQAATFYEGVLRSDTEASAAREMFVARGISEPMLRAFRAGYAPAAPRALLDEGGSWGYSEAEMVDAGLAVSAEAASGSYARMRGRIVLPVCAEDGTVLAFLGRAIEPGVVTKYIGPVGGRSFRAGDHFFGAHLALAKIRATGHAVVVTGALDALAFHEAGIDTTLALMGFVLTPERLRVLSTVAASVTLFLDGTAAGRNVCEHVAAIREAGVAFRVAYSPDGATPATVATDPQDLRSRLDAATSLSGRR